MSKVHEIDPASLKTMIDQGRVTLIDVREAWELAQSRIPDAQWHPTSAFDPDQVETEEGKIAVFYCAAGVRSRKAAERFVEAAGKDAYNMVGGIAAWEELDFPTVRGKASGKPIIQQVFIIMGVMTLLFFSLGMFVHPGFFWVLAVMGLNQLFVGVTGICWMTIVLGKLQHGS